MRPWQVAIAVVVLLSSTECPGDEILIQEDFEGTELSADWTVHLDLDPIAAGWTYGVAAGSLTVTDVIPESVGEWSAVRLRRDCRAPGEFNLETTLAWDTASEPSSNHAMQKVVVSLLDSLGSPVGQALYYDCWWSSRGTRAAKAGSLVVEDPPSSLPFKGLAMVRIERAGDVVSVYWDDQLMVSETETRPAHLVELSFWHYWHASGSFFGMGSFDYITVTEPETLVEPSSWSRIKSLYRR